MNAINFLAIICLHCISKCWFYFKGQKICTFIKQFKLDRSEVASNLNFPLYIHGNTNLKNPNKFSINIEKIHNFLSISNCHFSYDSSKFICYFTIGSRTSNKTKWIELTQMQRNTEKRIALLVNSTNCRIENVPPPCKISRIFVVNHTLINGLWHH